MPLIKLFLFALKAFSPDYQRGRAAAANIFRLFDRVPQILTSAIVGKQPLLENDSAQIGNLEFRNIEFRYPSRPDARILKGITFSVKQGETVALVGSSGCGKSTIIQVDLEIFGNIFKHSPILPVDPTILRCCWKQ